MKRKSANADRGENDIGKKLYYARAKGNYKLREKGDNPPPAEIGNLTSG